MVAYSAGVVISLVGYALGALGGVLLFVELFQLPSYITYDANFGTYNVKISPKEVRQYTWAGRVGALLIALAFALQFVSILV